MGSLAKKPLTAQEELSFLLDRLEVQKAQEPVVITLGAKASFADYMVVCTGRSVRHIDAVAENVSQALKTQAIMPQREGQNGEEWVLLDTGTIILHIFSATARAHYALEEMWQDDIA